MGRKNDGKEFNLQFPGIGLNEFFFCVCRKPEVTDYQPVAFVFECQICRHSLSDILTLYY